MSRRPPRPARPTPVVPVTHRGPATRRLGILTALWCGGFALVHGYWALGGRVGVEAGVPDISTRPVFLAYDVVAAVLLVVGAVLALRVTRGGVPPRYRNVVHRLLLLAAGLLLARGGIGVVQDVVALASGDGLAVGAVYDVWFVVAGGLFLALAASAAEPSGR